VEALTLLCVRLRLALGGEVRYAALPLREQILRVCINKVVGGETFIGVRLPFRRRSVSAAEVFYEPDHLAVLACTLVAHHFALASQVSHLIKFPQGRFVQHDAVEAVIVGVRDLVLSGATGLIASVLVYPLDDLRSLQCLRQPPEGLTSRVGILVAILRDMANKADHANIVQTLDLRGKLLS